MTPLDMESDRYQSRRVAYDVIYRGRVIDPRDMWWIDWRRVVERSELERIRQAKQQSDQDALAPR